MNADVDSGNGRRRKKRQLVGRISGFRARSAIAEPIGVYRRSMVVNQLANAQEALQCRYPCLSVAIPAVHF
jgi:hypothetical protein